MQNRDVLGSWVNHHPRESIKIVWMIIFLIYQTAPMLFGLGLYCLLNQYPRLRLNHIALLLGFVTLPCVILQLYWMNSYSITTYLHYGWLLNQCVWGACWQDETIQTVFIVLVTGFNYSIGLAPVAALGLIAIDFIPVNRHKQTLTALQRGKHLHEKNQKSATEIQTALTRLNSHHPTATVLGVSLWSGEPVLMPDQAANQVVLVLGTTGGGKTVTIRRFFDRAIYKKYPLIIVDGKPGEENVAWVKKLAEQQGQPFYGFNCGDYHHYDPLSNGGYTELKDKIISLKDEWANDYYRSIAEDYLQTTFEVLLKSKIKFDLETVVKCLDYDELVTLVRNLKDKAMMERVTALEQYDRKDITGLQAHLNLLIHSELGEYFRVNEHTFNLAQVIEQNGIVYFALPALRFPSFSKVLGKLVINDIKAVIDRYQGEKRIFTVFDEFSVFAGEQVLNLVNMGRGKGIHAIFGTQGLADLEKVDTTFKDQMLNCANTLICHRLNDQNSAESVAIWIGTRDVFTLTAQLNVAQSEGGLGSVRMNKEFIVHPDGIKQELNAGEAYLVSKVNGFKQDKIKIMFTQ
jgi:type IV secretory pathway TraG/TraD family ATPase VirD4